MILRRIANSIAQRRWGEFFVEILVVIVGVLLALEVDNWNDARSLKSDQSMLIESLLEDFRENQEIAQTEIERFANSEAAAMTLIEIVRDRSEITSRRFYSLVDTVRQRRTPAYSQNTWELLTADGQLTKIENAELKKQISSFYRYTSSIADVRSPAASKQNEDFNQLIAEHYDMAKYVYHVHPADLPTLEYDADAILDLVEESRPKIIAVAALAWHTSFDWRRNTESALGIAEKVEILLTTELERLNSE